jgi:hypothetical protein
VRDEPSDVKKFSRRKNADVKKKRTRGRRKKVSDAGDDHADIATAYEIRKSRDRLIRDIVQLGKELGRPPTILDLLCKFDRRELDSVSDILHWLDVKVDVSY